MKALAGDCEFTYVEGYPTDDTFRKDMIEEAVKVSQVADVAVLTIALPTYKESEGYDRVDLDLTRQQVELIKAVAKVQPNTVVVINTTRTSRHG
jgi:beta-glucosidase